MTRTQTAGAIATGFSIAFLAACSQESAEAPEVIRPIRIMTISESAGGGTLSYPGELEGVRNIDVAFEVAGRVVDLPAREGTTVAKGDLLAQLDPTDFRASLDAAEADFRNAKDTLDRYEKVFERGAIARQELDNQRRQFEVAQAKLDSARKALRDSELHAPFAGRVGRVYVKNVNNVQAKQAILLLQDLTRLEIVVNVPEQDWLRAKAGLSLAELNARLRPVVSLSSVAESRYAAEITEVATAADPVTRTFAARAQFDPPGDVNVLPGMSASLTIQTSADQKERGSPLSIPANAVFGGDDGGSYVWKVAGDMTVSAAPVSVGQMSGSGIVILNGLAEGDRIAVSGIQQLAEGMKVRELAD